MGEEGARVDLRISTSAASKSLSSSARAWNFSWMSSVESSAVDILMVWCGIELEMGIEMEVRVSMG